MSRKKIEKPSFFLAERAWQRLQELKNGDDEFRAPHSLDSWKRQYVWELSSIADTLGISGLSDPANAISNSSNLADFDARLARIITSIKVENRNNLRADSVHLPPVTKDSIKDQLEIIRDIVNRSNISNDLKDRLHKKIDAVEAELGKTRSSLRPFWLLAGALGAAATTVSTLADLPNAVKTAYAIVDAVHVEGAREHEERAQRTGIGLITNDPPKQITDQSAGNDT